MSVFQDNSTVIIISVFASVVAAIIVAIVFGLWSMVKCRYVTFFSNRKKAEEEKKKYKSYASLIDMDIKRRKERLERRTDGGSSVF